jgi:predicted AAA+ superfamily ATPase
MTVNRDFYSNIYFELAKFKSMVFMAGPRQVGKTTLARQIETRFVNRLYFNYDIIENKKELLVNPFFYENLNRNDLSRPLIVLDEIHKYHDWKNYLKSLYDRDSGNYNFLVLGSGRLDSYQKGGDSLAGRYLLYHLFPFTLSELANEKVDFNYFFDNLQVIFIKDKAKTRQVWDQLSELSGFPEPYLSGSKQFYRMWTRNYSSQLLREDIRDFIQNKKADSIALLFSLLPSKVGSPLSVDNLARDVSVSFDSVKNWLDIFDAFFLTFRISPWTARLSRAISKMRKLYLMDYARIDSEASRFENMVALELYRAVTTWNAEGFGNFSLHYLRNKEKEEVDFLIADTNKPLFMIETKLKDPEPSKSLRKFQDTFKIPAIQLLNQQDIFKYYSNNSQRILICSADQWLAVLP